MVMEVSDNCPRPGISLCDIDFCKKNLSDQALRLPGTALVFFCIFVVWVVELRGETLGVGSTSSSPYHKNAAGCLEDPKSP